MEKYQVKVLSYIGNFKKVLFICPICRENNSIMLLSNDQTEVKYKCDCCRKEYIIGLDSLQDIMKGMGGAK